MFPSYRVWRRCVRPAPRSLYNWRVAAGWAACAPLNTGTYTGTMVTPHRHQWHMVTTDALLLAGVRKQDHLWFSRQYWHLNHGKYPSSDAIVRILCVLQFYRWKCRNIWFPIVIFLPGEVLLCLLWINNNYLLYIQSSSKFVYIG